MDRTIDEYTAGELGVGDEEAGWVELVAGLGAEDGGAADESAVHFLEGVPVGVVEASGESAHDF